MHGWCGEIPPWGPAKDKRILLHGGPGTSMITVQLLRGRQDKVPIRLFSVLSLGPDMHHDFPVGEETRSGPGWLARWP